MLTGDAHRTVLQRKLQNRQVGRTPLPNMDSVAQAFCAMIEKSVRDIFRCSVGAMITHCDVRRLDATMEGIHLPAMLGIADMKGVQDQALVNLSSDLVYHIVDLRLGGDVTAAPIPTARSFTAIDSAVSISFIENVIEQFGGSVERVLGLEVTERLKFTHIEQNVTQINLANNNADVLVIGVNLDIGEAARSADFELVMPLSLLDGIRSGNHKSKLEDDSSRDLWREELRRAARGMQVHLQAVVARKRMTLSDLSDLKEGMVLDLPRAQTDDIELMLGEGLDATFATRGTLGARTGQKVLRLNENLSAELRDHLERLG